MQIEMNTVNIYPYHDRVNNTPRTPRTSVRLYVHCKSNSVEVPMETKSEVILLRDFFSGDNVYPLEEIILDSGLI